jgi:hypothetical protein
MFLFNSKPGDYSAAGLILCKPGRAGRDNIGVETAAGIMNSRIRLPRGLPSCLSEVSAPGFPVQFADIGPAFHALQEFLHHVHVLVQF